METELDKTRESRDALQRRYDTLHASSTQDKKKTRDERKAMERELEEARQDVSSLKGKVNQCQHEVKKREKELAKLKGQAKLFDKHSVLANSMEITKPLARSGPVLHGGSADSEFTLLVSSTH